MIILLGNLLCLLIKHILTMEKYKYYYKPYKNIFLYIKTLPNDVSSCIRSINERYATKR